MPIDAAAKNKEKKKLFDKTIETSERGSIYNQLADGSASMR
jgi:hypothetical protein